MIKEIQEHCQQIITTGYIDKNTIKQHISKDTPIPDFFNSIKNTNSNLYCQYLAKFAISEIINFQGNKDDLEMKLQEVFKHSAKAINDFDDIFISTYGGNITKECVENEDKIPLPIIEKGFYNNKYLNFDFKKELIYIHQNFLSSDKFDVFLESIIQNDSLSETNNNNIDSICYEIHKLFFNASDENELLKNLIKEQFGEFLLDKNGNLDNTKRNEILDRVLNRTLEFFKEELPNKIRTQAAKEQNESKIINIHNKAIVLMGYISQRQDNTIDLTQVEKISQSMIEILENDIKTKIDNYTRNIKNIGIIIEKKIQPFIDIKEKLKQISKENNYFALNTLKKNNCGHIAKTTEKILIENNLNSQKALKVKRKVL